MKRKEEKRAKTGGLGNALSKYFAVKIFIVILAVLAVVAVIIGWRKSSWSESNLTKIGFEDIGELATQSAYCTEVNVTEDARKLFDITIPFTQSKYVYSYDVEVKAGLDFGDIKWEEKGNRIEVRLPETKILSSEVDLDSLKIYHEDESIFSPITLKENNEALKKLKADAENNAVEKGLLENARENAEQILKGFFGKSYDLNEYEIVFKW